MLKKKIIGILVCTLLIATTISVVATETTLIKRPIDKPTENGDIISNINEDESRVFESLSISNGDTLDQYNTDYYGWLLSIRLPFWRAQGFTPTLGVLTRVELSLLRVGNPPQDTQVSISIRKTLQIPAHPGPIRQQ